MDEAANDLTAINSGVKRDAGIHEEIDFVYFQVSSKSVYGDFGAGGTVSEIEEGVAFTGITIEVDSRGGIETPLAKVNAIEIGEADEIFEGHATFGV